MSDNKQNQGLFHKLYAATTEVIKEAKKNLAEKQLRRKYESARDSALDQKLEAEAKLASLRSDFDNFDLNKNLEQMAIMKSADETIKYIELDYVVMFGEKMK